MIRWLAGKISGQRSKVIWSRPVEVAGWKTRLLGAHNQEDIACSVSAARAAGVPVGTIKKALASFPGVSGRLELVRTWRGVKIYNDTTSTTLDALHAALLTLGSTNRRNIILIFGGADKGLDLAGVTPLIEKYCRVAILLPGSGFPEDKQPQSKSCRPAQSRGLTRSCRRGDESC